MKSRLLPLLFLIACSCTIRSLHPAVPENGTATDTLILEGSWEVTEMIEQNLSAFPVIDVAAGEPGELILSMSSGTTTVSRRGLLADLNGMMVLSIQSEAGKWNIVRLDLLQAGQAMAVFGLDAELLSQARDAGDLEAAQPGMYFDEGEIEIRENQAGLASFLRDHPDAFDLQIASLRRKAGSAQ